MEQSNNWFKYNIILYYYNIVLTFHHNIVLTNAILFYLIQCIYEIRGVYKRYVLYKFKFKINILLLRKIIRQIKLSNL